MSSSSSPVLILDLQGHWLRLLPVIVLAISGLSIAWLVTPQWSLALLVSVFSLNFAGWALWQSGYGRGKAITRLAWQQDQHWQVHTSSGDTWQAVLSARSWCTPWLMCLKLRTEQGRITVLIWRTELSAIAWHHWQVRLRMEGSDAAGIVPESG